MKTKEKIIQLIKSSVEDINLHLPIEQQVDISNQSVLYGGASNLDSLGLVNLVVSIEQKVEDEFGMNISLADDRAMSLNNSPYRSIISMADYIESLMPEEFHEK